jgi:hypothetical protein
MPKTPETPEAAFSRLERKSENLFRTWRTACYRRFAGELKTDRAVDTARKNMEAAVIEAGNAYKALPAELNLSPRIGRRGSE